MSNAEHVDGLRMMKAVVMHAPGGPEVLRIERRPIPKPEPGQVLIRVEAFGLNRSELFTRQGHSPDVAFPRVLGIEAVGTVAEAPAGEFAIGQTVATVMGGMGRHSTAATPSTPWCLSIRCSRQPGAPCSDRCA